MQNEIITPEDRAVLSKLGRIGGGTKSPERAAASRKNGRLGGYWKQKRNRRQADISETENTTNVAGDALVGRQINLEPSQPQPRNASSPES